MIGAAIKLVTLLGVPERLQRIAGWIALAVGALLLAGAAWGAWELFIADVGKDAVKEHARAQEERAGELRGQSTIERAQDLEREIYMRAARKDAVAPVIASEAAKPPAERATLAPQIRAFNCAVLREDYTAAELAKSKAYRENCR